MKPILDDPFEEEAFGENQLTDNKQQKVLLYFFIMFVGSLVYYLFIATDRRASERYILSTSSFILGCMALSAFLEIIRFFIHRRKAKKKQLKIIEDPLWYKIYEGGFSIWILMAVSVGINELLKYWVEYWVWF